MAFPSGLTRSCLDLLLSFNYPLRVLIPFKIIAKESRSTRAREILTMKTSYVSHVLLLKLKCVLRNRNKCKGKERQLRRKGSTVFDYQLQISKSTSLPRTSVKSHLSKIVDAIGLRACSHDPGATQ